YTHGRYSNVSFGRLFATSNGASTPDSITPTETLQRSNRPQLPKIRTLSPQKLVQDDYLDFSAKAQPLLGVILPSSQSTDTLISGSPHKSDPTPLMRSSSALRPGTHGFLYYYVPPNSSPLAGELRFRVTSTRDPTSFARGSDLLTDRALPWRYPLYKMVHRPSYHDLVALLLQDGLVSQRTLDLTTSAAAPLRRTSILNAQHGAESVTLSESQSNARQPTKLSATPVLGTFCQEFCLRYTIAVNFLGIFASPDVILVHHMQLVTASQVQLVHGDSVRYCPFKGSVVCRFERSTPPKHKGKRVVVIRIVRMIESDPIQRVPLPAGIVNYPSIEALRPRVGELVNKVHYKKVEPWAVDVDKEWKKTSVPSRTKVLKVLFENEELYGSPPLGGSVLE
ncbi:hypothetical protein V8D89_008834, partial [Ganoderma adspersum]